MSDADANEFALSKQRAKIYSSLVLIALMIAPFGYGLLNPSPPVKPNYCAAGAEPDADTLVMLSATWCGYCKKARRVLQAEHIKHCEYDVEQSDRGRELYDKSLANGVPVFLYKDHGVYGYDMERVRRMVARR